MVRVGVPGSGYQRTEEVVDYTQEQLIEIAIHSMKMAIAFHNQNNSELIETAVKSTDPTHKIAAAWAFGFEALPSEEQQGVVKDFIKMQLAKIQLIHSSRSRGGNRQVDPRLISLLSQLNSIPQIIPHESKPYSNCILVLMRDRNPLVSSAARDSCMAISVRKYKDLQVDFGPIYNSKGEAKDDAALLWEIYFEKKHKTIQASD